MRRLVLPLLAAAAVALPAGAHAASPCRDRVYNEWYATGKISTKHPVSCYRDALRHVPADAAVYSDLDSSIKQALQAALARSRSSDPKRLPTAVGTGFRTPPGPHETKAARKTTTGRGDPPGTARDAGRTPQPRGQTSRSAVRTTGGSSGPPLPILVLGGIAAALAAAGAIGTGVRWLQRH